MYTSVTVITTLLVSLTKAMPAERSIIESPGIKRTGQGTIYTQGGVAGSCGIVHAESDFIVALSNKFMENKYKSDYCGKRLRVKNMGSSVDMHVKGKGKEITVTVADTCMGCDESHIDFSQAAWDELTESSYPSVTTVEWEFIDEVDE